ncbi:MAG: 5-formyltetrahydrofolate cyclo-ligase [Oscillospiraceae bacterium]
MQITDSSFDIREYKKELRAKYKQIRKDMLPQTKAALDEKICRKLVSTDAYKRCKRLLTYVSTEIEVDTMQLIHTALEDGKEVAVPRCIDGTRNMDFYIITSDKQLESGTFGVLEPDPEKCELLTCFDEAVCIVPALAYDMEGYRLGYGKGYYDRFLSAHSGLYNIGIEYCSCIASSLVRGRFDIAANLIVTEKYIKRIKA